MSIVDNNLLLISYCTITTKTGNEISEDDTRYIKGCVIHSVYPISTIRSI